LAERSEQIANRAIPEKASVLSVTSHVNRRLNPVPVRWPLPLRRARLRPAIRGAVM